MIDEQYVSPSKTIPGCLDEVYGEVQELRALNEEEIGRQEVLEALAETVRKSRQLHGVSGNE